MVFCCYNSVRNIKSQTGARSRLFRFFLLLDVLGVDGRLKRGQAKERGESLCTDAVIARVALRSRRFGKARERRRNAKRRFNFRFSSPLPA
eukprot:3361720-Rhodomonas_salina.1